MNLRRSTTGRAATATLTALCAVAAPAFSVLPATAARADQAVHAATAAPACAGRARSNPVVVTLTGVHTAYAAGGAWSTLRLTLHNRGRAVCGQLDPVLVYGARDRTLRTGVVRLESRLGGHWRAVPLKAALGELVGAVGPTGGVRLLPGMTKTLTVRIRLTRGAPHGEWLSLAVAYAPMQSKGKTVAWPVGVTDPSYFRVVATRPTSHAA